MSEFNLTKVARSQYGTKKKDRIISVYFHHAFLFFFSTLGGYQPRTIGRSDAWALYKCICLRAHVVS